MRVQWAQRSRSSLGQATGHQQNASTSGLLIATCQDGLSRCSIGYPPDGTTRPQLGWTAVILAGYILPHATPKGR